MKYPDWEAAVPAPIRKDLWRMEAYRLALFLAELSWHDSTRLSKDRRSFALADQLVRAAGNISSNLAEGYSRGTGKDRARFYEYSLGSARETRDWYYKSQHVLTAKVVEHRIGLTTQIIKLCITMVSRERRANRRVS